MSQWYHPFTPAGINDHAPRNAGIYEVGTLRNGHFTPYYTGMSQGNVHQRLAAHVQGRGNSNIAEYMQSGSNNHLYFRTREVSNPVRTESNLIRSQNMVQGGWNRVGGWGAW